LSKRFIAVVVVCILVLIGIFALTNKNDNAKTGSTNNSAKPSNHTVGGGKSGVTLLEYGDFQCPACGAFYPVVKNVVTKYQNDITFQFRNFPLTQIHPNAFAGARAAEAAALQGKFWEMHDLLYENQTTWSQATSPITFFDNYAQQLNLDITKFKSDYNSAAVNNTINADIKAGQAIGADSTPTFVLNSKKITNPTSQAAFEKLITDAIAAKNK
jgi:protein-disulfide isomerase